MIETRRLKNVIFNGFYCLFCLQTKLYTLQLNKLKTRTAMNEKISMNVICVEAIIYLILYCTFKANIQKLVFYLLSFLQ